MNIKRLETGTHQFSDNEKYGILWMGEGPKKIKVDSQNISSCSNLILFLLPGTVLQVQTGKEFVKGWMLLFSKKYLKEQQLNTFQINHIEFIRSTDDAPVIILSPKIGDRINVIAEMINELTGSNIPNKETAISALLKTLLVYCDSRCNIKWTTQSNAHELHTVSQFKRLVSQHVFSLHRVSDYAAMLHVSPKHLNHLVKKVMGVTAKSVIIEQLILQATRDLKFSEESIKEISFKLGFKEAEHFSHFFKKEIGLSPSLYRLK